MIAQSSNNSLLLISRIYSLARNKSLWNYTAFCSEYLFSIQRIVAKFSYIRLKSFLKLHYSISNICDEVAAEILQLKPS